MSDGGLGNGVSYWATINIRGDLSKEQLRAVLDDIRKTLKSKVTEGVRPQVIGQDTNQNGTQIEGLIRQSARLSTSAEPVVSVSLNPAKNQ